jgi:hypothetical protein
LIGHLAVVVAVLIILWFASNAFARANPAKLARVLKPAGGLATLAAAAFLMLRGQIEAAVAVGGFGLYLLGVANPPGFARMFSKVGGASGGDKVSRVRSAMIEMELHHDSGAMEGTVLAGPFGGARLADLTRPQCQEIRLQCQRDDPEGARLLEAYLDRRFPGWRPAGDGHGDTGRGDRHGGRDVAGAMTEDEAYEILGLAKGASSEEVARAHRSLMKKLHPDYGGPTALAAKVNEAKSVLSRRHS